MDDSAHTRRRLSAAAARLPCAALLLAAALAACGCATDARQKAPSIKEVKRQNNSRPAPASDARKEGRSPYGTPSQVATLEDEAVRESSGLVASRRNPGLFWTHNDSGARTLLHAFDRSGRRRGVWRVAGAASTDWEGVAAGPGPRPGVHYLYVGDIGDNGGRRAEVVVYRVAEPEVTAADAESSATAPRETEPAEVLRLRYPDGAHNAEALLVHPSSGDLYVVTKEIVGGAAGVYKLAARPAPAPSVNTLKRVGEVRLPVLFGGLVTGGDISPDGRRVVLCDYTGGYEFTVPGGGAAGEFDGVWRQEPLVIDLGERRQGESVCYGADGESIYATSEKRPVPLFEVRRGAQGR